MSVDLEGHYKTFEEYSKTVRGWFIAYGVGAPVLFLTQQHISKEIVKSGKGTCIILLFLSGVVIQILIAIINKWNNWFIYLKYDNAKELKDQTAVVKFCCRLSEQAWIDIVIDILSFTLFIIATSKVLFIFLK